MKPQLKTLITLALTVAACLVAAGTVLSGKFFSSDFQLGASLSMTTVFGLVWLFGVRYPDVTWMLVTSVLLTTNNYFFPTSAEPSQWIAIAYGTANFALMLSYGVFALAFFRFNVKTAAVSSVFIFNVALFFSAAILLPEPAINYLKFDGAFQSWVGASLLAIASVVGFVSMINLPPKRQRYVGIVATSSVTAAIVLFIMGKTGSAGATAATLSFNYILSGTFGMLLLADLVIFHRTNVSDPAPRTDKQPDISDDSSLGRTIQTLLLPDNGVYEGPEFTAEIVFSPSDSFGGDWHYVIETAYDLKIIFGEVSGSGASGALGVAAIVSLLHEAQKRDLSPQAICKFVNHGLIQLFERKLTTTLTVISLATDGTVEVSNSGGMGFIEISRKGTRFHALSSSPLGMTYEPELAQAGFSLAEKSVLITATAGHFTHNGEIRSLLEQLDEHLDGPIDLEKIRETALTSGANADQVTDQTMIIIQKHHQASTHSKAV